MVVSTRKTGIQVEGLDETIKALGKFSKEFRGEAVEIFRDEAKTVQGKAKARAQAHPSAPRNTAWIGRSATSKGAGVKLKASHGKGLGMATEWGMHKFQYRTWSGSIRRTVQRAMSRRTFRPWKGNNFKVKGNVPGYVIQPAIRDHLPGMEKRVADRLQRLLTKALDRAGVRRG